MGQKYRCIEPTADGEFARGDLVAMDHISPLPLADILVGVTGHGVVREYDHPTFWKHFQPIAGQP